MAQAPASNSGGKSGGGSSKGGASSSSTAATGKASTSAKGNRTDPIVSNANHMPVLQARKGQSGEYATKGKWSNWADGQDCFKG
jgi:hypothetical protein